MEIEKIKKTISSANLFGSADMIAGLIAAALPETNGPGVYEAEWVENEEMESEIVVCKRDDDFIPSPCWQSRVSAGFSIEEDNSLLILIGCGTHSVVLNLSSSGDVLDIFPDDIPSDRFWGDGNDVDVKKRADITKKCMADWLKNQQT